MFGLTWAQVCWLFAHRKEIGALVEEFVSLGNVAAHDEQKSREKVADVLKVTQRELDIANRATERSGN